MKTDQILVLGASANIGAGIAESLRKQGYKVRTTTSRPVKTGESDKVQLNLVTGEGLKQAFEGVDRAFFLSPSGIADMHKVLSPLIQEAKRRGLKKVVMMTAFGANEFDTPFRRAEIELEKSGLNYNIIRPNWFMQNFNSFWIEGIKQHNKILLPTGEAKGAFIDTRDIIEVAAKLLTTDNLNNKDYDLTGPESMDHHKVAQAITEAAGRKITYEEIPAETLHHALLAAGLPADYSQVLMTILAGFKAGSADRVTENVELILGRKPRTVQAYAQDYKKSF